MEKHEAVVSGIMSSIGFDTLEVSEQTTKVISLFLRSSYAPGWHHLLVIKLLGNNRQHASAMPSPVRKSSELLASFVHKAEVCLPLHRLLLKWGISR